MSVFAVWRMQAAGNFWQELAAKHHVIRGKAVAITNRCSSM
jgi:hypothetical protein